MGAISIGTAHIGPIVSSAKKNPADKHAADTLRLWTYISGIRDSAVSARHTDTIQLRASRRFPLRRSNLSVTTPPSVSPTTPAKNTPEENKADCLRSRL